MLNEVIYSKCVRFVVSSSSSTDRTRRVHQFRSFRTHTHTHTLNYSCATKPPATPERAVNVLNFFVSVGALYRPRLCARVCSTARFSCKLSHTCVPVHARMCTHYDLYTLCTDWHHGRLLPGSHTNPSSRHPQPPCCRRRPHHICRIMPHRTQSACMLVAAVTAHTPPSSSRLRGVCA